MDGLPDNQIPKEKFLKTKLGKITVLIGLITVILVTLAILKYFQVISLFQLNLLSKPSSNKTQSPQKLTFSCPTENTLCKTGKIVKYSGFNALAFELPRGSPIKTITDVSDSQGFIAKDKKGVRQTIESDNTCFTITYTLTSDAKIEKIQGSSIKNGTQLASVGLDTLLDVKEKANILIQIQKIPVSEVQLEQTQLPACSIVNLRSQNFGQYINFALEDFKI